MPSTIAGVLFTTYLLAAWELSLPVGLVVAAPLLMLALAGLMVGTFPLSRSLSTTRYGKFVLLIAILTIYWLGLTQSLPAVLFTATSAFCIVGFVRATRRSMDGGVEDAVGAGR